MADWFKFYENDLDDTRLQYAISKLPEVVSVYVGILSVCCKDKSHTIRWGDNEIELFGFSRRLGISIPKVNEAVRLLVEIDYITQAGGTITVTLWNSKQSEYCRRDIKRKEKNKKTVRTKSAPSPHSVLLEERRGEEKRAEEKDFSELETASMKNGGSPLDIGKETYSALSRAVLHELNELTGSKFRERDSSLAPIHARLQEPDVTIEGVRLMVARQYALWKGTEYEEYMRPSTLFGERKFNEYYAARELPVRSKTNHRNPENPRNLGVTTTGPGYGELVALKLQRQDAERQRALETELAGKTPELGIAPP